LSDKGRASPKPWRGWLPLALRLAVAVGLTAFIVWRANFSEIVKAATTLDLRWAATAILLVLVDRALNAYRWIELLCALTPGSRPPFRTVLRIFFVSTFVGSFLPSVGGDIYRAYSLASEEVRPSESAASVLMDRALGVLSIALLAMAALPFVPQRVTDARLVMTLGLALAGCGAVAFAVFSPRAASLAQSFASRVPAAHLQRITLSLSDAVRRYAHHRSELVKVLAASIGVQFLRVIQAYCLGRGLSIDVPLVLYFVFIPLATLVMQLPVTILGLGIGQLAFVALFGQVNVPASQSVALSILFIALGLVGNLPGAALYAWGRPQQP
jgi:glycosyltransferase 2 family protein